MKISVKESIADILVIEGVEYVFGHTGGHIRHLWEALRQQGLKTIFNKQEGNAVYMADAYAKLSGKLPVVLGTSGPGVENMVSGLSSAFLDSVPILVIGALVPSFAIGKNALQDSAGRGRAVEQRLIFKACCKQALLALTPQMVPDTIREALRTALSDRKGPVFVEIPSDYWDREIDYESLKPLQYRSFDKPACSNESCLQISQALYGAKRPLIIVGDGASESAVAQKVTNFLERINLPFAAAPSAKNLVDEYSENYLGALRLVPGKQKVYKYMAQSDFILLLGARANQWEVDWNYNKEKVMGKAKLAQVDPDCNEIGRSYPVDLSAFGSISSFLSNIEVREHEAALSLKEVLKKLNQLFPRKLRYKDDRAINPYNINNIVEENAAEDAIIVCDTGFAGSMAITKFRTKPGQTFLLSDRNSPMGYGIPASLGAALTTTRQVICFVGDGSFQMSLNELGLLLDHNLKIIFVLQNNSGCEMIAVQNRQEFGHASVTKFKNPDYTLLAKAYGIEGIQVRSTEDFEKAFKKALTCETSVVIDAIVDQESMEW